MINGKTAFEVKAKTHIGKRDFRGLTAIRQEALLRGYILVSLEDTPRRDEDIHILHWKAFIVWLWQDVYF